MGNFRSTKVIDGFSTCFRQWRAKDTHCSFIHGYGVSVKFIFKGELDNRNWVVDFGGFKRSKIGIETTKDVFLPPKQYLSWLLDHTMVVAEDDPELETFQAMSDKGMIQLRTIDGVGCEKFAEYIGTRFAEWCTAETMGRAKLISCEFREHEKNSAIWFAE